MSIIELTQKALEALERVATEEPGIHTQRAQAILLAAQGEALDSIAEKVGLTQRQILYWLRRYQRHGADIFPGSGEPEPSADAETRFVRPILPPMETPGVQADDAMSEAGRKVLAYHFIALLNNEGAVRERSQPEAIHDMRAAIRRLRSTLDIFGEYYRQKPLKRFRKELGRLSSALGTARDLEVVRRHAEDYAVARARSNELQPLLDAWRSEENEALAMLIEIFDSGHYLRFLTEFAQFVTTPGLDADPHVGLRHGVVERPTLVRHVAPANIYQRYAFFRAYEVALPTATLDTLHALRIAGKHLRYSLEAFAEILGPEGKKVIQAIKTLQNHLGAVQDARVAADMTQDYLQSTDENLPVASIAEYLAAREEEKQQLMQQVAESWIAFNQPELRRTLALSIAVL